MKDIQKIYRLYSVDIYKFILSGSVFLIGAFLIEKNKKNKKDMDMYESKK